jgi:hypothetical protein
VFDVQEVHVAYTHRSLGIIWWSLLPPFFLPSPHIFLSGGNISKVICCPTCPTPPQCKMLFMGPVPKPTFNGGQPVLLHLLDEVKISAAKLPL